VFEQYDLDIYGVIHVGGHYGQEYDNYVAIGMENIVYIEPLQKNYDELVSRLPQTNRLKTIQVALGNVVGEIEMFVETANQGQSSSNLDPGKHLDSYPQITFDTKETVKIDKLDNLGLDMSLYNVLNLDTQGYELEVIKGGVQALDFIDLIFVEVNTDEVYKGCAKLDELDAVLSTLGFERIYTILYGTIGYGDAIYIRK
jgi:FkbM family methyltransferase